MSLRTRLALLYTSIVGGILLLFGTAVYLGVSITLTQQIDDKLREVATQIIDQSRVGNFGNFENFDLPGLDLAADVYIQFWSPYGRLLSSSKNFPRNFNGSLDTGGQRSATPVFRDVETGGTRLRVLTVPLNVANTDRLVGRLQVGVSLAIVDATQRTLLFVLLAGAGISMLVAGLAGWVSTHQTLAALQTVKEAALQITRADDLSRRIPYAGPPGDEVGQLIDAFNQTLSRLENLFLTQRRFLADVGHELRTPLTVIKGNVDLMRRSEQRDDESLDSIDSEITRLTRMVGDLLLLAQAESGKLPIAHLPVELDTLLLEVMQQMRVLASDNVQLKLGEIDQVLVCGDHDRLKQVLVNLVGNAIRYTPNGGEVVVGVGKEGRRARLTVSDTGPGIPPEDLPHIFERFYRGEKSRTRSRDGKGFGLGLSIAYWIVRNHGGQIEATNHEPHGTTFCVWIPLAGGPAERPCAEENPPG